MAKVFKVVSAPAAGTPKSLKEALELAEKTGVLEIPGEALCLCVNSGIKVEIKSDGK